MHPQIQIVNFQPQHHSAIKDLLEERFGKNYLKAKPNLFRSEILLVASNEKQVVGFCAGHLLAKNQGILDVLAVHINFQHLGIGTALFRERLKMFATLNVNELLLFHWVSNQNPIPVIALKNGFTLLNTVPNYWKKESKNLNYHCVQCGPPPCSCSCKIYRKMNIS